MGKKILLLILFLGSVARSHGQGNRIGILSSKISTLVFNEEVLDTELGSQEYHIKVKGRYLLLRAKHRNVQPTSLFVRYGKKKQHHYVAEIFPDETAPLMYLIEEDSERKEVGPEQKVSATFTDHHQEYFTIGVSQNGIQVILNKMLHIDNTTSLQLFIKNTSSIDLCLDQWTFEYITTLKGVFFSKKKRSKLVEPISPPDCINVPAKCGEYVVFSIPTYVSEGGLEIFLGEEDGERGFRFFIPNEIILKANRKVYEKAR